MEREYPNLMHPFPLEDGFLTDAPEVDDDIETLFEQGLITDNEATILRDPALQEGLYAEFQRLGLLDGTVLMLPINEND